MLAERWNGAAWAIQPTPSPRGAQGSVLAAVWCASASACTAAGYYYTSTGTVLTLAERWDGTAWTFQSTPNPGGAQDSFLYGVSCPSASACTAAGYYNTSTGTVTLAERWDGTAWTIQPTPNPRRAQSSFLTGVSCPSASACTAAGYYNDSTGIVVTLAERWDGTAWTIQPTPSQRRAQGSFLTGVSCPSASACTAAGYYYNSTDTPATLAERWNGTAWTIQPTPNPRRAHGSSLDAVSCTSASACTATGYYNTSTLTAVTLAERWNGTAWTIHPAPNPHGAQDSFLYGVSCPTASACIATGYYNTSGDDSLTLAERWNGAAWAIQPTPNRRGAQGSNLDAVSCPSASACTAVGTSATSTVPVVTLAERWNGTAWTIQPTPNRPGAQSSDLQAVSCPSASACTATGYYYTSTGAGLTLAERWNGTAWTIQPTPNPRGARGSFLYGVSCPSASACTATGYYFASTGAVVTLAERWNGTAWTIQPTPNPRGAEASELYGVSCPSASACTAVGYYNNSTSVVVTLAERWNGTAWTIQPTPNPRGAQGSSLDAVSCPSASACTAVGTLAESWNGTAWTIQPTPNPRGAYAWILTGVSCPSASACTAAGDYNNSTGTVTLAERWNSTAWTIQPTPNPGGAQGSYLTGVSCPSASACTAAGDYYTYYSLAEVTLAERYS
jgi:hypothetical protein